MSQHAFGVFVAGDEIRGVGIPGDQNELVQRPVLVEELGFGLANDKLCWGIFDDAGDVGGDRGGELGCPRSAVFKTATPPVSKCSPK
jgi:hypothetical protein